MTVYHLTMLWRERAQFVCFAHMSLEMTYSRAYTSMKNVIIVFSTTLWLVWKWRNCIVFPRYMFSKISGPYTEEDKKEEAEFFAELKDRLGRRSTLRIQLIWFLWFSPLSTHTSSLCHLILFLKTAKQEKQKCSMSIWSIIWYIWRNA